MGDPGMYSQHIGLSSLYSPTQPRTKSYGVYRTGRGFTLVELLVSAVVLVVAVTGSIVAFNLITQSVRGTGIRADQNRRVDRDIASISLISEEYTGCVTTTGTVPADPTTHCSGTNVEFGNSYYYFPEVTDPNDATTWVDAQAFSAACRSTVEANHITANFVAAVNGLAQPGGDVTRQNAVRVNPVDASNHLIEITWVDPTRNNRVLRQIEVLPLVTAWCP